MNRTDRLVAMVLYLQGRRVVRAEDISAHFEVSLRTVYRDVAALGEAGVPISGKPAWATPSSKAIICLPCFSPPRKPRRSLSGAKW
ncbi:MAG: HTH domain-containing protein [Opitutaceae bacterium]|nr:HTH domain-containing protein [Opitutaceae bacterium]